MRTHFTAFLLTMAIAACRPNQPPNPPSPEAANPVASPTVSQVQPQGW